MNGQIEWANINWCEVENEVRNLRQRIYKASKSDDLKRVGNLQKLMLRSKANWLQAIRRVTQINRGCRTPGVDREVVTTPEERVKLFLWLHDIKINQWNPPPVRRVEMPKGNGKVRPLGIPTVRDRVIQAIVKNALEPFWEARFESSSFGFRPGHSAHDAIETVWNGLNRFTREWIVDADIKGAFDNIDHEHLMSTIGLFPGRFVIRKWLKAGIMNDFGFEPTVSGTPQGGIISPLLANIALHGIEQELGIHWLTTGKVPRLSRSKNDRWDRAFVRYADDLVVLCKTEEDAKVVRDILKDWLGIRGLELSPEKTRIVHIDNGFEFLGFEIKRRNNVRRRRGRSIIIRPSKKSINAFRAKVRTICQNNLHNSPHRLLMELNPLITGWGMYFRTVVSGQTFKNQDAFVWHRVWRYSLRRHPNKSRSWVKRQYFNGWTFWDMGSGYKLRRMNQISIVRHIKLRRFASKDDPALEDYWKQRARQNYVVTGQKAALWKIQSGLCPHCNEWLDNGEELHRHHKDGDRTNYKNSNILLLHEGCHYQKHQGTA